jgi:hypothetical protein
MDRFRQIPHTRAARLNVDERHGSMSWLYVIDMDGNPVEEPVEEETASKCQWRLCMQIG